MADNHENDETNAIVNETEARIDAQLAVFARRILGNSEAIDSRPLERYQERIARKLEAGHKG